MTEIKTINDAREAGAKTREQLMEAQKQEQLEFEALLNNLQQEDTNLSAMPELAALLALDDAQFDMLAPVFLQEIEKSYNDPNTQLLMVRSMNVLGKTAEDIEEEYASLCVEIDTTLGYALSAPKRDFLKQLIGFSYNAISAMDGIAHQIIHIPIEYCHSDAKMPAYAHPSDAGMDVYALEDITIAPGETKLIPIGIKVAIPLGYELQVRPKSGRCLKTKLRIANAPGTIDAGYRDEIGVIIDNIDPPIRAIHFGQNIYNESGDIVGYNPRYFDEGSIEYGQSYTIGKGEKFAQLVLNEVPKAAWVEVESVADNGEDRGGGFGSTGLK